LLPTKIQARRRFFPAARLSHDIKSFVRISFGPCVPLAIDLLTRRISLTSSWHLAKLDRT